MSGIEPDDRSRSLLSQGGSMLGLAVALNQGRSARHWQSRNQ